MSNQGEKQEFKNLLYAQGIKILEEEKYEEYENVFTGLPPVINYTYEVECIDVRTDEQKFEKFYTSNYTSSYSYDEDEPNEYLCLGSFIEDLFIEENVPSYAEVKNEYLRLKNDFVEEKDINLFLRKFVRDYAKQAEK